LNDYRLPKFNGRTGVLPPLEDGQDTRFRSLDDRRSADLTLQNQSQSPLIPETARD